ncbi:MAG: hypothetical protein QOE73_1995 [Verrucomicrobiota bacterium]
MIRIDPTKNMKKAHLLGIMAVSATLISARADVIPSLSSTSPTGGNFTWNYSSNVTVDQMVTSGDFFTIYDFGNFVAGSNLQPVGWTFSSSLIGTNPALVAPTDDPTKLNLTWTYIGAQPVTGSAALGIFSVVTDTNQTRTSDFASSATKTSDPNGSKVANIGSISVPVPEMSALLPILSVCGAGLVSLIPSLLRRRPTT